MAELSEYRKQRDYTLEKEFHKYYVAKSEEPSGDPTTQIKPYYLKRLLEVYGEELELFENALKRGVTKQQFLAALGQKIHKHDVDMVNNIIRALIAIKNSMGYLLFDWSGDLKKPVETFTKNQIFPMLQLPTLSEETKELLLECQLIRETKTFVQLIAPIAFPNEKFELPHFFQPVPQTLSAEKQQQRQKNDELIQKAMEKSNKKYKEIYIDERGNVSDPSTAMSKEHLRNLLRDFANDPNEFAKKLNLTKPQFLKMIGLKKSTMNVDNIHSIVQALVSIEKSNIYNSEWENELRQPVRDFVLNRIACEFSNLNQGTLELLMESNQIKQTLPYEKLLLRSARIAAIAADRETTKEYQEKNRLD